MNAFSLQDQKEETRQPLWYRVISKYFQYTIWLIYYLPYPKYILKGLSKLWKNNYLPIIKGGEYTCWPVTLVLWFLLVIQNTWTPFTCLFSNFNWNTHTIYLSCIKKYSIFIQISLKAQKIYSQGMEGFLFLW